jgi:hypothetical protein
MKLETRIQKIETQLSGLEKSTLDGDFKNLPVYIELKKVSEQIKKFMDVIKSDAQTEMSHYGTGEHIVNGVVCSVSGVGGRWDYKHINEWRIAKDNLTEIENKYKSAYKSHQNGLIGVESKSGTVVDLPTYKGATETIKIKIPKKY